MLEVQQAKGNEMEQPVRTTTLPYPDYSFVDFARGGVTNRNNVVELSELEDVSGESECYRSYYRFPIEYQQHCEETGSVAGSDNIPCHADHLWFDIDEESNLENALVVARKLVSRITTLQVPPESIEIYFSGSKGFHIGLPAGLFGWEPSTNLPRIHKALAKAIAGELKIDSIYDAARLFRMNNTLNAKSNKFKIRLQPGYFMNKVTIEEILEKADAVSEWEPFPETAVDLNERLHKMYMEINAGSSNEKNAEATSAKAQLRPCIDALLNGVAEGERSEAGIRIASEYRILGYSEEDAQNELAEWNLKNTPPLENSEVERLVKSAYKGNYNYHCEDSVLSSRCAEGCPNKKRAAKSKPNFVVTGFVRLSDGTMAEACFDPAKIPSMYFSVYKAGQLTTAESVTDLQTGVVYKPWQKLQPFQSSAILLPTQLAEYDSQEALVGEIEAFIRKYFVTSAAFTKLSAYYVLMTYVYDCFDVVPYLRAIGDFGSGKSRFLKTVGSLCYRPIFAQGATSVASIFRLLSSFRGTLVFDEVNLGKSDDSAAIVQILNSGYQKGQPVWRSSGEKTDFEPLNYDVFGPKLIASRNVFDDAALESRCLTVHTTPKHRSKGLLITLPPDFAAEALAIRNKLTLYRMRAYGTVIADESLYDLELEPRLEQIIAPIFALAGSQQDREVILEHVRKSNELIIQDRQISTHGKVIEAIAALWGSPQIEKVKDITMKEIAKYINRESKVYGAHLSPQKAGSIVVALGFDKPRGSSGFHVARTPENGERLRQLEQTYGFRVEDEQEVHDVHEDHTTG